MSKAIPNTAAHPPFPPVEPTTPHLHPRSSESEVQQTIDDLNAKIKAFRQKQPAGIPPKLGNLLKQIATAHRDLQEIQENRLLSPPAFQSTIGLSAKSFVDFGFVRPG